ncbi:putative major facilitator superfamily transporter [Gordonia araii NBRC 100433]|uniref:Putative major facilitator superfamily transporter n=1 Tax=Gordonia araii NBRC 100433 TaxID=1073574 RepID=G7H310_9ACTN|nr:MFS transporter [Gordonia araii]NNG97329.1 MFS transporter [Gordonia araii NBRC 100433]GAB10235.1 putative major facilitator superfamily transporter [Gordonia araii NBRC 100433]
MTTARRLDRGIVGTYALGSVGTGGFGVLPGLVLAYYLTDSLAVPALVAAGVVLIPKLIDVAINPLIGAHSDRLLRRTGSRRAAMLVGAIALAPLFVLTFCAPVAAWWVSALWVLVAFSLTAVAYSLFQVPYVALPAELTPDYDERTRLVATRIAVLAAAILLFGAGGPAIRDAVGGARGYLVMAVVAGLVISAGMVVATIGTTRRSVVPAGDQPVVEEGAAPSFRDAFAAIRTDRRYQVLVAVYVVQALASAVMLAGAQYLATYVLGDASALQWLFVSLVAPALLVMPLWYRFGERRGKLTGLRLAATLFSLSAVVLVGTVWWNGPWIYAAVCLAGIGYAGMQTFPLAMLPDVLDAYSRRIGRPAAGSLSGLWTAAETVALAVGPAVFLLVLAATGFVSSTDGQHAAQPESALIGISVGFAAIPALLVVGSLILLRRYAEPNPEDPDES